MTPDLRLPAPAKLNLFLHITGRREDGYHELQTLFRLLDHGDELDFTVLDEATIDFACDDPTLDNQANLVVKAAELLGKTHGHGQGIRIRLHKRLPAGGGLGGGSSDAATTLLALNHLWGCGLGIAELAALGRELGADVPVFVQGHTAWAEGVGDQLRPMTLPDCWYLVLTPPCAVSTAEIFGHRQLTRHTPAIKIPGFPIPGTRNDCERVACLLHPEIREALDWLGQYAEAHMTGTGSSLFADFGERAEAEAVLDRKPAHLRGFVARGLNASPVHQRLAVSGA